jgi:hypothetical protein
MGTLERHDEVFHRLLFDRRLREQVRAGGWSIVGDVAGAFCRIDMDELEKLAVAVRDGLIKGSLGGLGIGAAFPGTIAALGGGTDHVADRFLAATGGAAPDGRPTDATGRRAGVSVLEAFYGWAATELEQRPPALCQAQHELAAALLAALTRTPRPGFLVEWPLVHPGAQGWYCALDAVRPLVGPQDPPEQPVVYVAVRGRYATGRLSPALAAVVLDGAADPPGWVPERLARLDPASLDAARRALAARGLS